MNNSTHTGIDVATGPYAVKGIQEYLPRFTPVGKIVDDPDNICFTYGLVQSIFAPHQPPPSPNVVIGTLSIHREQRAEDIRYIVRRQTEIDGFRNLFEADITCQSDEFDTLKSWEICIRHDLPSGDPVPTSLLRETGRSDAGLICFGTEDLRHEYRVHNPVVSLWTLFHFLMVYASEETSICFDLLQDLSRLKPNQTLAFDGKIEVKVYNYYALSLDTYVHTGPGILPIHYLFDERGLPQLITANAVAWALTDIE